MEWWARRGGEAVPFLRRGCSWRCSPVGEVDDGDDEEGRVGGGGWRSGTEMEVDVDLVGEGR